MTIEEIMQRVLEQERQFKIEEKKSKSPKRILLEDGHKRIHLKIAPELHKKVKIAAAKQNITITNYITRLILSALILEKTRGS